MLVMLVVGGPFSECVMLIQKKNKEKKRKKKNTNEGTRCAFITNIACNQHNKL